MHVTRSAGAALLAASVACGLVIPDTVPAFSCVPGAAGACPNGQACAIETHQCVAAATDGGSSTDGPAGEAGVGTFSGCSTLACRCAGAADCASGLCGDQLILTPALYAAANNSSFCTKPCCTSADCDGATVCLASAPGANYCVRPEWLGRTAGVGSGPGGAACSGDGDCRSGLCVDSICADVCCSTAQSDSQCAAGSVCGFGTFPGRSFDQRYVPLCAAAAGTAGNGAACASTDTSCRGGLCAFDNHCHDACRNSTDCGSLAQECAYVLPDLTHGIVAACRASTGTGTQGTTCQNEMSCQSGFCSPTSMLCTDVCYADSDCTEPGWRCRPEVVTLLGKSYSVLACGS